MLATLLIVIAALIVLLVIVIAMQPAQFRITREATISASPVVVFAQVNDLYKWPAWSPWAKLDPNAKTTYAGPPAGKGAFFSWAGNNQIGEGSMTITESRLDELVVFKLEFLKPFAATNTAEFTFQPQGSQTVVTWSMSGQNNFMSKAFGLIVNCDKMIGGQFEKGLADLKLVSENTAGN
jgi:hypothetical protein